MKGFISGIFLLLLLVSFCLKAESQRFTSGVILAVIIAKQRADEALDGANRIFPRVTSPFLKPSYKECGENYFLARLNLERAIEDLKKGIFTSAPTLVDQALRDGTACYGPLMYQLTSEFKASCREALSIVNEAAGQP